MANTVGGFGLQGLLEERERAAKKMLAKSGILEGQDFLLEIGRGAQDSEFCGHFRDVAAEAAGMAEETVVGAIGLADAEASECGSLGKALTRSGHGADGDIILALGELLKILSGIVPQGGIVDAPGLGVLNGAAADINAQGFLEALGGGSGFRKGELSGMAACQSEEDAMVRPKHILARGRELGASELRIVQVGESEGLREAAEIGGGIEHVIEKEIIAGKGLDHGFLIEAVPVFLGVVGEEGAREIGRMEDGIQGDYEVIVRERDLLEGKNIGGVFFDDLGVAGVADDITDVIAFDDGRKDVPIRLKNAGELPVDGLDGPDFEELLGRSVFPKNTGPGAEDIVALLDKSGLQGRSASMAEYAGCERFTATIMAP